MTSSLSGQPPVLRAEQLNYDYGGQLVIDGVSFALSNGTLTALVGPNGAGKSTLLHLLQGRLRQTSGAVQCNGSIALMPQKAAIDWSFPITVEQMVKLGKPLHQASTPHQCVDSLLVEVGMNGMGSRRLNQLSGGQQQRVLLARALMQNASVLLLDEPCSAIDPPTRAHLLQVMRQQANRGQALLVSSHDWGKALDSYDRVLVINKQLVADGTLRGASTITGMDGMMGDCCA